jgi:hypothetical protein
LGLDVLTENHLPSLPCLWQKVGIHFQMTATLAVMVVAPAFKAMATDETLEKVDNPTEHLTLA